MLKGVSSRRIIAESDTEEAQELPKVLSKRPVRDASTRVQSRDIWQSSKKRKLADTRPGGQDTQSTNEILMGRLRPTQVVSGSISSRHPQSLHSVERIAACCGDLLLWYSGVKAVRGMPWRKDYDPSLSANERTQRAYEVLVSEVMLQQTQISTVIPYYKRWMRAFPTISALALSDIEKVNQRWKGLGYYSRGSRLLDAARVVMYDMSGHFPEDAVSMEMRLPGVGRYTGGAVCSIVFDEHAPAVDGNVQRLLSRLLALHAPLKGPKAKAPLEFIWDAAAELVKGTGKGEAGAFNQALIELGSTICKPTKPNCEECPVMQGCGAYLLSKGKVSDSVEVEVEDLCKLCKPFPDSSAAVVRYPMKVSKKKARAEYNAVSVIEYHAKSDRWVLLVRRPEKGLLAGLYEFPTLLLDNSSTQFEKQKDAASDTLLNRFLASPPTISGKGDGGPTHNLKLKKNSDAGTLLHLFSHIRMTYHIRHIQYACINDTEEGYNLPELLEPPDSHASSLEDSDNLGSDEDTTPKHKRRKTAGTKAMKVASVKSNKQQIQSRVKWVRITDVESENISTGALKIWKQVIKRSGSHGGSTPTVTQK